MRALHFGTAVAAVALTAIACGVSDPNGVRPFDDPLVARPGKEDWVLVLDDSFDDALEPARWHARVGDLGHPKTLNSASPELASVGDGRLIVKAAPTPGEPAPYAAGYLETKGLFAQTYGKIEFRLRCDFAPGVWYAVWGRPWIHPVPELDFEFLAENVNQAWLVNHWALPPVPADERRRYTTVDGIDISVFHTYSVIWGDSVEWQIDGKPFMRVDGEGVPHEPMFWIINAWVGGWGGTPTSATAFPAGVELDWFRVYRPKEWRTDPKIRVANARAAYARSETIDVELADFDRGAHVEVWEGDALLARMDEAPFRWRPASIARAAHRLTFVGTDGGRRAQTELDLIVK